MPNKFLTLKLDYDDSTFLRHYRIHASISQDKFTMSMQRRTFYWKGGGGVEYYYYVYSLIILSTKIRPPLLNY